MSIDQPCKASFPAYHLTMLLTKLNALNTLLKRMNKVINKLTCAAINVSYPYIQHQEAALAVVLPTKTVDLLVCGKSLEEAICIRLL